MPDLLPDPPEQPELKEPKELKTPVTARELMARAYRRGTRVTNCVTHMGTPLDGRPLESCALCRADILNALQEAWGVNEWLNQWRDEALTVLARQDSSLQLLQGFEIREYRISHYEAGRLAPGQLSYALVIPARLPENELALAAGLTEMAAEQLLAYLEHVVLTADGTVAALDIPPLRPL